MNDLNLDAIRARASAAIECPEPLENTDSVRGPGWYYGIECPLCDHVGFDGTEDVVEEAWHEHMAEAHTDETGDDRA